MSVSPETVDLLRSLVAMSPLSQREIAQRAGWPQPNMNAALAGKKTFPRKWLAPMLDALGVEGDWRPMRDTVWLGAVPETEIGNAFKVLGRFFRDGGEIYEFWPKAKKGLGHINLLDHRLLALSDHSRLARVVLRIDLAPNGGDEHHSADLSADIVACVPGLRPKGRREVEHSVFRRFCGEGKAPAPAEFDQVIGGEADGSVHAQWDDVLNAVAKLRQGNVDPTDVLRALEAFAQRGIVSAEML